MAYKLMSVGTLADKIQSGLDQILIIDSRSFLEFNTSNVHKSVNVCCSKLVKRRLQQGKISICELLAHSCQFVPDENFEIVVYDQCSADPNKLTNDNFVIVLLQKLHDAFNDVRFLAGGFLEFQATHPKLCQNKNLENPTSMTLTSVSQPCLPVSSEGPTKILPFMFLGSQQDALSKETSEVTGISYVLNVSISSPKPSHIQDSHFLRIPVNDNYCAKLLPHFHEAFQFIEKVREANGCVLIHCVAGISRSPTLAIAYMMNHLKMSMDEAYRHVKDKRPTISPNFNFLGQLLEFEKQQNTSKECTSSKSAAAIQSILDNPLGSPRLLADIGKTHEVNPFVLESRESKPVISGVRSLPKFNLSLPAPITMATAQSPTTALAKLNFNVSDSPSTERDPFTGRFPTTTLDKLSFTPCIAHDENVLKKVTDENLPSKGTKRPLSLGCSESRIKSNEQDYNQKISQGNFDVTMRSPEIRAKRPLVRPNSIAFSTYPKFDLVESNTSASDESKMAYPFAGMPHSSSCSSFRLEKTQGNILPLENTLGKASRTGDKCGKSRSLEDILNSPNEDNKKSNACCCTGQCKIGKNGSGFAGLTDAVQCRCRGMSDPHLSSSSISSGGSHNSLHGSLEIIQVS